MKLSEYPYQRPELESVQQEFNQIRRHMEEADHYEAFKNAFFEFDDLCRRINSEASLVNIRHTVDTRDEFYRDENDYFNQILPVLQEDIVAIKNIVLDSPYADQLKQEIPETFFELAEMERKAFSPELIEDLQRENQLTTEYQALVASAQIPFDGKTYTLAGLTVKMNDPDREVRRRATKAYWGWFQEHQQKIGEIYDELVHLRDGMARKLGFENYIPLGYLRMFRLDYDQNDVARYRAQVLEDIVPVCSELYERQRERLGLDELHVWDEKVEYKTGTPKPLFKSDEIKEKALEMFRELSPQTGEFFQFMMDHDCMDLDAKPGKAAGGYCTFLPEFSSPFIFANFSDTAGDLETFTHESGHAFQIYSSQNIRPLDCMWPTMESCEIHSMSMEFFTWPWMEKFFGDDTDKYYYNHLSGAVKFLPYGVLVDHFQHKVYENPDMTMEERMAAWRELEKMYLPHKNYEEIDVLEKGGWWMRQLHIFMDPFYYIDYTLAQVCALQFWNRIQKKDPQAFADYQKICRLGGSLPFRQIVKEAGLKVPFEKDCLKETAQACQSWFEAQDDGNY